MDEINSPRHYVLQLPRGRQVECIEVIRALGFHRRHWLASAFAYLWRCQNKAQTLKDLKKAVFYLQEEIRDLEEEANQ